MALNYDSVTALINDRYVPTLTDLIFSKRHYLWALLMKKAKSFNEWKIVTSLEYANGSNAMPTLPYQTITLKPIDPFTAAEYSAKMVTDSLLISKEEDLVCTSPSAVINLVTAKMKNVKKGLEKAFVTRLWSRTAATADVGDWNCLYDLINTTNTIGGISGTDYSWWRSNVLTASDFSNGDITNEADLMDPTSDCYILNILQRLVARAKYQTGENPDMIIVTQYLWDLIERILDPRKTGSKLSEKAANLGFTALTFRDGIEIVADDDSVEAQTSDDDAMIYALNTNYMYAYFNEKAKFTPEEFIIVPNMNARSCKIHSYGNLVVTNRGAHSVLRGVYTPRYYSRAAA